MDPFKKALNDVYEDLTASMARLRAEVKASFDESNENIRQQGEAIQELRQTTDELRQKTGELQQKTEELHQKTEELHQKTEELHQKTEELHQKTEGLQHANGRLQQANERLFASGVRHAHVLDQTLAGVNESLTRHRENMGTVVYSIVEDVNGVKTDIQSMKGRLDALERRTPPAA